MSNFSYPCEFPVGITILDLTGSVTTIADLDLAAARTYVAWWNGYNGGPDYNEWDDHFVGSMWPVGMTLADAMYYYWNASTLNFSGLSADFVEQTAETPDPIINLSSGGSSSTLFSNFWNFRTNYSCPPSGYNAANFGDQFYASKIVAANNCLSAQATNHSVAFWNYNSCSPTAPNLFFGVGGFDAKLSFLNAPFYGGDGTRESLRQNYPSIIKVGNLYYPAIELRFDWAPEVPDYPSVYGAFYGHTFYILKRARVERICGPDIGYPDFEQYSYLALFYDTSAGPYSVTLNGFPSGNSYQIPIYNIYNCTTDDNNECPTFGQQCDSTPFNVEMGSISITGAP
jgi:hypothetical protein